MNNTKFKLSEENDIKLTSAQLKITKNTQTIIKRYIDATKSLKDYSNINKPKKTVETDGSYRENSCMCDEGITLGS